MTRSKKKNPETGGERVTLRLLVSHLLADIRDELLDGGEDGGPISNDGAAVPTSLQQDVLKELKAGTLNLNKLFAALGLDWKTYLSTLIADLREADYWWGKRVQEVEAKAAKTYKKKYDPLPYYECAQPLCRLTGPRQIFMLDQPDLWDDAGNPQVRYQCPDCKGFAISKSSTDN